MLYSRELGGPCQEQSRGLTRGPQHQAEDAEWVS